MTYGNQGAGGGGSSFLSGMPGCVAINPAATNAPRTQDTQGDTSALNYNDAVFGNSLTWNDGDEIIFDNPSMVDGQGYEWNTGAKGSAVVNMPNRSGGTMTGNTGPGYARITLPSYIRLIAR
jgi:hypothetical protein